MRNGNLFSSAANAMTIGLAATGSVGLIADQGAIQNGSRQRNTKAVLMAAHVSAMPKADEHQLAPVPAEELP